MLKCFASVVATLLIALTPMASAASRPSGPAGNAPDNAGQRDADQTKDSNSGQATAVQDATIRVYAGPCSRDRLAFGGDRDAAHGLNLAELSGGAVVGVLIDALSGALKDASAEQVRATSAVINFDEQAPKCIAITRPLNAHSDTSLPAAVTEDWVRTNTSFFFEFYLHRARSGGVLAVAPIRYYYAHSVARDLNTSRPRDVFATLAFTEMTGAHPAAVTASVPIGRISPGRQWHAMNEPPAGSGDQRQFAVESGWVTNPFQGKRAAGQEHAEHPVLDLTGADTGFHSAANPVSLTITIRETVQPSGLLALLASLVGVAKPPMSAQSGGSEAGH